MTKNIILLFSLILSGIPLFSQSSPTIKIVYKDTKTTIDMPDSLEKYISVVTDGTHLTMKQSEQMPCAATYQLCGKSNDGEFVLKGDHEATITLEGLTLHNPYGSAVNIQNKKQTNVYLKDENILSGGTTAQNACWMVKGKSVFTGNGRLTLNAAATGVKGLKSKHTVIIEDGTIDICASGDIDTTDSLDLAYVAGIKADRLVQNGGRLSIHVTGTAGRGISADQIETNGGELSIQNDAIPTIIADDVKSARGMKAQEIALNDGNITIMMSGDAGKGIVVGNGTKKTEKRSFPMMASPMHALPGAPMMPDDNHQKMNTKGATPQTGHPNHNFPQGMTPMGGGEEEVVTYSDVTGIFTEGKADGSGPVLNISTTGGAYNSSSAKAVKAICAITIYGGTNEISTEGDGAEGIESKSSIDIKGGKHILLCSDDCINSAGEIVFDGGTTICYSTDNDGVDSNAGKQGAITIGDGSIYAFTGKGAPEEGLDCDNSRFIQIKGKGKAISGQLFLQDTLSLTTLRNLLDKLAGL